MKINRSLAACMLIGVVALVAGAARQQQRQCVGITAVYAPGGSGVAGVVFVYRAFSDGTVEGRTVYSPALSEQNYALLRWATIPENDGK